MLYKTKQTLSADTDYAIFESAVPFAGIGTLQLLEIWYSQSKGNSSFYLLNIVRKNAKRVNVITECRYEMLLADAGLLNVPLYLIGQYRQLLMAGK